MWRRALRAHCALRSQMGKLPDYAYRKAALTSAVKGYLLPLLMKH